MSEQNPYEILGVQENASFEEIQEATKRLKKQYDNDTKQIASIEMAYDAVIMDRLRRRQEGKIKVPDRIRFPDKSVQTAPSSNPAPQKESPAWLQDFMDTPSQSDIIWPAGIFLLLGATAAFYPEPSLLPLLMSLGICSSVYFLGRKERRYGRAVLITLAGLFVGIGLGISVANLINAQNGGTGFGPEQFASIVTFFLFWLISSFLR